MGIRFATILTGFPVLLGVLHLAARPAERYRVTVDAGSHERAGLPVRTLVPASLARKSLQLRDASTGDVIATQRDTKDGKPAVTWILAELAAGQTRSWILEPAGEPRPPGPDGVRLEAVPSGLKISIDGGHFTTYVTKGASRPYCWPIIGPTGEEVTRAYPMRDGVETEQSDHPHHRSLWFGYDKVNGHDFWRGGKATTVHRRFLEVRSGPVFGEFVSQVDWISTEGKKICEDYRRMRVYRVPGERLFDMRFELVASEGKIELGDSEEGMFAFRVAGTMKVSAGGTLFNANGQRNNNTWGKRTPWCDYSGPLGGETVGIAILDHPKNFRFPTYWHVRPYGLFCANRFGIHDFTGKGDGSYTVPAGQSLAQRFRIIIHAGNARDARIAARFASFSQPPEVTIRAN